MSKIYSSLIILVGICLSACAIIPIHRPDVQQGTVIDQAMLSKIHTGMSPAQVQNAVGPPLLANLFDNNQLVYVYSLLKGRKDLHRNQLVLTFVNNRLSKIATNVGATPQSNGALSSQINNGGEILPKP